MAEIRIINLPTRTPVLTSDFFVFEKEVTPGTYVTAKAKLSAFQVGLQQEFATKEYVTLYVNEELEKIISTVTALSSTLSSFATTFDLLSSNILSVYLTVSSLSSYWTQGSDMVTASADKWNDTYNSFTDYQSNSGDLVSETVALAYAITL